MIGVLLMSIGTFFEEVSDSIGKFKVKIRQESPYTMAFLSVFRGAILFAVIGLVKHNAFTFSTSSLPTFTLRAILEILQLYFSIFAIIKADRSTFNFIRTGTIPLLLIIDLFLGYSIGLSPIIGIIIITITLCILGFRKELNKKGIGRVIACTVNAALTISLFKYDISHFNSIAAEQLFINIILLISFFIFDRIKFRENPILFLKKRIFLGQSLAVGIGGVIESFAYNYGAASIITTAKRGLAILWSIITGKMYFKEKHIVFKILILIPLLVGVIFLVL